MGRRLRFKAAVLKRFREPFEIETVELEAPEGWVWVRVKAVGVCGRDRVVWLGGFRNLKPPLILGHEVFGELDGKPVGVYPALLGDPPRILGEDLPGGYAEYVAIPQENIVGIPDERYEAYASAVCGVATFIHASRLAGVGPGSKVLVTGASGGVGIHGIQYLLSKDVKVYAYTRRPEAAEKLRALGAEPVSSLDFYRAHGRVDVVFELVGAATFNQSMRAVKPGGVVMLIGNVGGEPITIERPALLVMREICVKGSAAFYEREYREAVKLVGEGAIKPFYKTYKLDEVNNAYTDIQKGRVLGRAVLTP